MEEQIKRIQQAKSGDPQAFAGLYGEIYKDLYRFALYTLKNTHDAEDAVSETVMDAWVQIRSLRREESFRSWMFQILANKCRRRLKSYLEKTVEIPEDLCSERRDQETELDVKHAFFSLAEKERLILSMHLFGGYSSREIGRILNLNDNTVRSRQKRALEKMEAYLA